MTKAQKDILRYLRRGFRLFWRGGRAVWNPGPSWQPRKMTLDALLGKGLIKNGEGGFGLNADDDTEFALSQKGQSAAEHYR